MSELRMATESPAVPPNESIGNAIFNDPRISVLSLLIRLNALLFLFCLPLQVTIGSLDPRSVVRVLALAPIAVTLLNLITSILHLIARKKKNPLLLLISSLLNFICCIGGIIQLLLTVGLLVIASMTCAANNTCSGVVTSAVILSLITVAGTVVNISGIQVLWGLIFRSNQPEATTTTVEAVNERAVEIPPDSTSVVNEGFTFGSASV